MKIDVKQYQVAAGKKVSLNDYSTCYNGSTEKDDGTEELAEIKAQLTRFQEIFYAADSHSILIMFQAMDAAGKDGVISHVMSGLNPQGCQVYSFKAPTSEEYDHDFLWRHYKALPERGRIGVHNRSHYENVLVCKVHPEYVLNERVPGYTDIKKIDETFWKRRYESIRNFEKHLTDNGTVIIKIFLYVSKEEQKKRFLERIDDPAKNWKFSSGDIAERGLWKDYMKAYEEALSETSTEASPWYIVPADKKWYARLVVSDILLQTFKGLDLKFPVLAKPEQEQLVEIKKQLLDETIMSLHSKAMNKNS
ncbi:polyphosphate kinase 2 family protein [Pedobacter nyackensis]|uniref:Polyphosphate:nucleotide phosphotransferase, PPK2 family n=1 Tax=Pedobacter nyackensis TaxID=475255 RepID=A0A1W2DTD1_9SPHI|nr:polyphosphate kinase 2 family protein [Pedobacter nyackensis]SMD00683.1 polyphosphate:nucleotide phosphotransferase, PPK2 family [Pedobacter nyackensis]